MKGHQSPQAAGAQTIINCDGTVVNAPGMAPLNKTASAGESLVRQERDFWIRRPGPRNRRKRQRTSAETEATVGVPGGSQDDPPSADQMEIELCQQLS